MPAHLSPERFRPLLTAQVRVVSFDVFDTVVCRTFARPADLFVALGAQLHAQGLISFTPARFARLRVLAEAEACAQHRDGEPDLGEIMELLARRIGWSESTRALVLTAELALERTSLQPLAPIVAWVEEARRAQKEIVFMSDMYLPSEFLREILVARGIAKPADAIFVSNEYHASKATGALFQKVVDQLKVPASAILHIGDNEHSDLKMAQRAGLQALRIGTTQLGAIERNYLPFASELQGLPGRLAAAARLGRINASPAVNDQALDEIGAGLLGPLLTAFVLWSFARAQKAGLKRLYFVSRDGQVIREVALALQRRLPSFAHIECRYLYGSRIAWHHASLTELTPRHLRWLLDPQPIVHAGILAHRLGVEPEVIARNLGHTAAATLVAKPRWDAADLALLRRELPRCQEQLLAAAGTSKRVELARAYFEQEGLFDGTAWGVVELGWSGSMMTSFWQALGQPAKLPAFYLCQTQEDPELPPAVLLESFLMQPGGAQVALGRHQRLAEMIEALTAADHPTVLGYQKEAASIGPRLKNGTIPMWAPTALASLRGGTLGFVEAIDPHSLERLREACAAETSSRQLALILISVLARFCAEPTRELASPFTACSFSEDPADEHRRNFAEPLSFRQALAEFPFGPAELWREGSLACSSGLVQALIAGGLAAAIRHLRRRLFRAPPQTANV